MRIPFFLSQIILGIKVFIILFHNPASRLFVSDSKDSAIYIGWVASLQEFCAFLVLTLLHSLSLTLAHSYTHSLSLSCHAVYGFPELKGKETDSPHDVLLHNSVEKTVTLLCRTKIEADEVIVY